MSPNFMTRDHASQLLQMMLGPSAAFREGQWDAIKVAALDRGRSLVVQRTGWGKSVVYFLATKLLRETGAGPTLLISPLLSLMRNQVQSAGRLGIRAVTIHSENVAEWRQVEESLKKNEVDVLLISPERLGNSSFLQKLLPLVQGSIGMFVVDEAHCISDWGHDFRPDYRRIVRVLKSLPPKIPVICTTATANDRVVRDIEQQIPGLKIMRGPLIRSSLRLYAMELPSQADRLAWLAQFVPELAGSGIIYTLTIDDSRRVASWLQQKGINAEAYHADLEGVAREAAEQRLLNNEVKAMVATVALGMGFDKPDLGFVIHFQRPGSVVAYYQQVGRAGRAVESAFGILLSGREDDEIQDYFIRTAFPPHQVMQDVLTTLQGGGSMRIDELGKELNYGRNALERALKLLEVDGAVQVERGIYSRTANPWRPDPARFDQVTQLRRDELEQIKSYVKHPGCLMEFLAKALDDPQAAACGKCMNCTGKTRRRMVAPALVQEAINFLRADELVLEPRLRWPKPVLDDIAIQVPGVVEKGERERWKTPIPDRLRARAGRALCVWGDSGWGTEVARCKYETGVFSDALVNASARLIAGKWQPDPGPAWVTAVPSQHRLELVSGFAARLASRLGIPFLPIISKIRPTRPQKEMENSVQQLRNLLGAFELRGELPKGPVLLVDDVIDSGWTLTLLAILLQAGGSGPVYPFVLAKASPRGS